MLQKVTRLDSVPTAEETVLTTDGAHKGEPALHPTLVRRLATPNVQMLQSRELLCHNVQIMHTNANIDEKPCFA